MLGVAGLTARPALRLGPAPWRLRMGVVRTRRQRGVPRRLVQPLLQLLDLRQPYANDRLGFRWLPGNQFVRDLQRHAIQVAETLAPGQSDSPKILPGPWPVTLDINSEIRQD